MEDLLETEEIQGNALPGFNKPYQSFSAFAIQNPARFAKWLGLFAEQVTSCREVYQYKGARKALALGGKDALTSSNTVWSQIAFTADGLRKICNGVDAFADRSFLGGMAAASHALGDWQNPADPGHPSKWVVGAPGKNLHVVINMAADDSTLLKQRTDSLTAGAAEAGLGALWSESAHKLGTGHEHFGFEDGISQPGVRGTLDFAPGIFLTERLIDPSDPILRDPNTPELSAPGQPLIWPGQFVFGYQRQNPNDFRLPDEQPPPGAPIWSRNGSFLVFRRLQQDVAAFRSFLNSQLAAVQAAGFQDLTIEGLAALLVGRWQSGVPLIRSPRHDPGPPTTTSDPKLNAFNFSNPEADVKLRDGTIVPGAPGDPFGVLCPFSAHIRKVNPRDAPTDLNSAGATLPKRVLRRGIPFGEPYSEGAGGDRGLFFVSVQTSISDQFEFLQAQWADSAVKPFGNTGNDLIIGQSLDSATRTRTIVLSPRAGKTVVVTALTDFVTTTGGGYFFAPSRSTLRAFASGNT